MEPVTINEAISKIMKERGYTQFAMAKKIGKEKATDVSARLASKNMTFNKALEMLEVMGYEVTVQPMKTEPGPRIKGRMSLSRAKPRREVETSEVWIC